MPVIRKQLNASQDNGKVEAELLYLLGSLRHRNIVEILTSYVQFGIPNLLFSPAEMDLHGFLLMPERPPAFIHNYQLLRAMQGLSSSLTYWHNFKFDLTESAGDPIVMIGYHRDIKPRNILIRGFDFIGLARLQELQDDTKTRWKDTTFEYGPPECRDSESFEPRLVGRALDIWSLGCIFSELLAYAEGGSSNVTAFRLKRVQKNEYRTMRCFHDGEKLSSNVSKSLDDVVASSASMSFHKLSELVRQTFSSNPVERLKAEDLKSSLFCHLIEELLDRLLESIVTDGSGWILTPGRHLYMMRLSIEKYRLLAWADGLGFRSIRKPEAR